MYVGINDQVKSKTHYMAAVCYTCEHAIWDLVHVALIANPHSTSGDASGGVRPVRRRRQRH
jgi:hypothetical protein